MLVSRCVGAENILGVDIVCICSRTARVVLREAENIEVLLDRSDGVVGDVIGKARAGKDGLDDLAGDADWVVWVVVETATDEGGHSRGQVGGAVQGVQAFVEIYGLGSRTLRSTWGGPR